MRLSTLRYFLIIAGLCAILLLGIVTGILFSTKKTEVKDIVRQPPTVAETREKNIVPRFSPLDPVSGDWGISPFALSERMNETLDAVGARSSIIKKILTPAATEFRYAFSAALIMLGETAANGNVTRTALFFDPVFSPSEYQNARAVIRAIIAAIDPSLDREAIFEIERNLGLSQDIEAPAERNAEIRLGKFALRLWSVAGSAFVFTASSM